jgi:UDP-4-amino-4,6-dideoxy-N-acetyl-beta-L-altrosamine N-acetyltransferase
MSKLPTAGVRPMEERDLKRVFSWRMHPEVRRYMFTQDEISFEEHVRWFAKASQDPRRQLLVFEIGSTPLGFISICKIEAGGVAEWGFYSAPEAPKGTGRELGRVVLQHTFQVTGVHKICGKTLIANERSIQFHLSLGFVCEGVLRQHHFDGKIYHDVVCFGLLAGEWQKTS